MTLALLNQGTSIKLHSQSLCQRQRALEPVLNVLGSSPTLYANVALKLIRGEWKRTQQPIW